MDSFTRNQAGSNQAAEDAEERSVSDILADAQRELERVDDLLRSYLQYVCDRISLQRGAKDWYRLAGESRIKDAQSVRGALGKRDIGAGEVWAIDDIVGARIVALTLSDVAKVASFIEADGHPFADGSLEITQVKRDSGYRALHVKGRMLTPTADIGCEIQIRTAIQDAWAVVSRAGLYGTENTSFVSETARILADQLAANDQSLDLLRRTLHEPKRRPLKAGPKTDVIERGAGE
jgi:ppGpp synthetase/RelA/SpoT-type nucleotidyltranferase